MISSNADEAYHIPSIETNFADCVIDVDCLLCLFFFLVACVLYVLVHAGVIHTYTPVTHERARTPTNTHWQR